MKFHWCVAMTSEKAVLFKNGQRHSTANQTFNTILGGGDLVLGQDQDSLNVGDLDPNQSFK